MRKKLTVIVDNNPFDERLKTDWGFSALLEVEDLKILFDLGNELEIFKNNVEELGIDLSGVDYLFISHYDSDHIGGLDYFLEKNNRAVVLVPYNPDYFDLNEKIENEGLKVEVVTDPMPIGPRSYKIFSTGVVSSFPRPEHSLYVFGSNGYSIIAGCSHPKVWNIAKRVEELTGFDYVDMYIGGYHFYRMNDDEIREAVRNVVSSGIRRAGACHCTGDKAREVLRNLYGENFIDIGVGKVLEWY